MDRTYIIGLTGGIGVGKSTVCKIFEKLNLPVIYADLITHKLLHSSQASFTTIVERFGNSYVTPQGELDKAKLRKLIFSDLTHKKWLEDLLHPLVKQQIIQQTSVITSPYCIVEIPLLIETNCKHLVDSILLIECSENRQIQRTCLRDNCSKQLVMQIIATQASKQQRQQASDDIIHNDGSLEQLTQAIIQQHKLYLQQYNGVPKGIRTPVTAVKGRCPRPLDDGDH